MLSTTHAERERQVAQGRACLIPAIVFLLLQSFVVSQESESIGKLVSDSGGIDIESLQCYIIMN